MSIHKIIINFLLMVMFTTLGPVPPVFAALSLDSSRVSVGVDSETADINYFAIKISQNGNQKIVPIIDSGNLLSLTGLNRAKLSTQRQYLDTHQQQVIESVFNVTENFTLTRRIQLAPEANSVQIHFDLKNSSTSKQELSETEISKLKLAIGFEPVVDAKGGYGSSIYAFRDPFISQNGNFIRLDSDNLNQFTSAFTFDWLGWVNRYYVVAIRSLNNSDSESAKTYSMRTTATSGDDPLSPDNLVLVWKHARSLSPGESYRFSYEVLAAAKSRSVLSATQPNLDGVVLMNLWDWFRWVCFAISQLIYLLFSWTNDWGLTLILTALVVRIFTIPITRISLQYQDRATAQQLKMKSLVADLKGQYQGLDLSQQMVDMYERERFDHLLPFKSMLGLFVQIPIFIALFNVLAETPELSGVSFLWINDLALSDRLLPLGINLPFFGGYLNILPFLMAIVTVGSTYYATRKSSRGERHPSTLFGMAGVFFILFYSFPAALVLYWTFSNFFQWVQQILENNLNKLTS